MKHHPIVKNIFVLSGFLLLPSCSTQQVHSDGSVQRKVAADFTLQELPKPKDSYDLNSVSGKSSYYDYMRTTIAPAMEKLASSAGKEPNQQALTDGLGVGIELDSDNYNFHVNFPMSAQGGRSYGWTSGQVGDWSDQMYLDHLSSFVTSGDPSEMNTFYQTLIQLLGACNPQGITNLQNPTQRVATNFLAIFTAEQYRAIQHTPNWDDALLQVTMLGAFHGGQRTLTKFYDGKFSSQSFVQAPGVYRGSVKGTPKSATLDDYWQDSSNANSNRGGINETRGDFEKMGVAITKYESSVAHSPALGPVQAIVGSGPNVIESISQYFTAGRSKNTAQINAFASDVAKLLLQINKDADQITDWEQSGE